MHYHVAAFAIAFNLICNMTMFFKKLKFDPRVCKGWCVCVRWWGWGVGGGGGGRYAG